MGIREIATKTMGVTLCVLTISVVIAVPPAKAQVVKITVGKNVQVSQTRPDWHHDEVLLSVDPTNSQRMIACSVVNIPELAKRTTAIYTSSDGGNSWQQTMDSKYAQESADPICLFGPDGTAYYGVEEVVRKQGRTLGILLHVYRSADGGRTWPDQTQMLMDEARPFDRWFPVADACKSSSYQGRVYIGAFAGLGGTTGSISDRFYAYGVMYSSDKGASWSPISRRMMGNRFTLPGNCDTAADGMLACVFWLADQDGAEGARSMIASSASDLTKPNGRIMVVTSKDGGDTLLAPNPVDQIRLYTGAFGGYSLPHIAIDRSSGPFGSRFYVVWADHRSGKEEIFLSYSEDRGKTWSKAHLVSDDRDFPGVNTSPWHYMPEVAVSKDGIVGVLWYDRRDDPSNLGSSTRFAASLDGGDTFTPSVVISEQPHRISSNKAGWPPYVFAAPPPTAGQLQTLSWLPYSMKHIIHGETIGLATDNQGGFRALWTDNRTGLDQVWTASMVVSGKVWRNGSEELSRLQDVSDKLSLEVTRWSVDSTQNTVSFNVRLRNISDQVILGSVKLRVIDFSYNAATQALSIMNSDNGERHAGAVWDFTSLMPKTGLRPGDLSSEKTLLISNAEASFPASWDLTSFQAGPGSPKGGSGNKALRSNSTSNVIPAELSNPLLRLEKQFAGNGFRFRILAEAATRPQP